jgi:DNA-binding CsgD family transcriptional regulator
VRLTNGLSAWPRVTGLVDRRDERRTLDLLVQSLRDGQSRALAVLGEPGIGKTALLDYVSENASGCRVERIAGFQSEMELPFAAVRQLCVPFLDRIGQLPAPQRDALETAFGLGEKPPGDRFLAGLAVLELMADAAEELPLLCLVDDQQWLDFASAQVLSFAARRLGSESIGMIFAARQPDQHLAGLPELSVTGLPAQDAAALLESVLPGRLDSRIRDQIVAETRGNPLALLELTRGMTPAELAFGLELPGAVPLSGEVEESFRHTVCALPDDARLLLMLAAAEPTGDPVLMRQAAAILGISGDAVELASEAGLVEVGDRVRFRHPLVRSAAYRAGSGKERQLVHQSLADVTDRGHDAERYAWHLAQAAAAPSEEIALELGRAAELALARGCLAAAGAYLQRAVALSADPSRRTDRAIMAAQGKIRNGAFDTAAGLLSIAQNGRVSDLQQARIDLVKAQLAHVTNRGGDAPALLLQAARRLESVDAGLARATYLDAISAAAFAGRFAADGGGIPDIARAAAAAPRAPGSQAADLLFEAITDSYTDGARAMPAGLRPALASFGADMSPDEQLRWIWVACMAAMRLLDDEQWDIISARHLRLAREAGALAELPLALNSRTTVLVFAGQFRAAHALADEAEAAQKAIRSNMAPYGALALAALRGDRASTADLSSMTIEDASLRGEGIGLTIAHWASAALKNGSGDYDGALAAAVHATEYGPDLLTMAWPTVELVEAAARAGDESIAAAACERLSARTLTGTDWALGLDARCRALITQDDKAEDLYWESIMRLGRTRQRTDLARAHLLYGEWLRRQRRRSDSRAELATAEQMFAMMGMSAFAGRAARELRTAGETSRRPADSRKDSQLTPQEAHVARLAAEGLSNQEIATRLFISRHTVQYHLRKVFAKLGISSRAQLDWLLPPEH